jgi:transposase
VGQTLFNWVKAHREWKADQCQGQGRVECRADGDSRLRAELARVRMERDFLGKATAFFAKGQK